MHTAPPHDLLERLHRTKRKHKHIALAIHERACRQTRQKIAWAILHHSEETLAFARSTLALQMERRGRLPRYRAWSKILEAVPERIAKELLRADARVQVRNSCHPFGNALAIYEAHHPQRSD